MPLVVKGMADMQRALSKADRDVRLGVRKELREAAEPVRRDAQLLADTRIRKMGPPWSVMRVGVTRTSVYVAPRKRGVGRGDPAARPNLAPLLMGRALEPALDTNTAEVRRRMEHMLDTVADRFNRD